MDSFIVGVERRSKKATKFPNTAWTSLTSTVNMNFKYTLWLFSSQWRKEGGRTEKYLQSIEMNFPIPHQLICQHHSRSHSTKWKKTFSIYCMKFFISKLLLQYEMKNMVFHTAELDFYLLTFSECRWSRVDFIGQIRQFFKLIFNEWQSFKMFSFKIHMILLNHLRSPLTREFLHPCVIEWVPEIQYLNWENILHDNNERYRLAFQEWEIKKCWESRAILLLLSREKKLSRCNLIASFRIEHISSHTTNIQNGTQMFHKFIFWENGTKLLDNCWLYKFMHTHIQWQLVKERKFFTMQCGSYNENIWISIQMFVDKVFTNFCLFPYLAESYSPFKFYLIILGEGGSSWLNS